MSDLRVRNGPGGRVVTFTLDGRPMSGVEGEPIGAALHAEGVKVLGRSFKYRRPRGLHCVADACPNCAMRVNGLPGVTTCTTPLRAGDVVERQKGAPSAERDVLGAVDRLSAFTPVGFQYRRFRRSPRCGPARG
jgi:sarcosine oxidase subunit alpha